MPLVKATLESSILSTLDALFNMKENPEAAKQKFAKDLADAIDTYIKSGDVNVNVVTAGSPAAHTGTGTGKVS